jgi:hypothetical protein
MDGGTEGVDESRVHFDRPDTLSFNDRKYIRFEHETQIGKNGFRVGLRNKVVPTS